MKNRYDLLNDTKVSIEEYETAPLNDLEKASMKQKFRRSAKLSQKKSRSRWIAAAACIACVVCFSQTAFAQTVINGILQNISLGHNHVIQVDPSKENTSSEQFFDKNGKPITQMGENTDIYDANGKKLGTVSTKKESDTDKNYITETDMDKAVSQLIFKPQLPKSLPANYIFDHATLFPDEKGKASGDYLNLTYKNGENSVCIAQRRITPETTYTFATDGTVEKLKVNGHDAALVEGHSLEWESDGASISISGKALTREELIHLAESFS